jgi:cytochrome c
MKKSILFLTLLVALISCKKEEKKEEEKEPLYPEVQKSAEEVSMELGKEIFNGRGTCHTCHKPNEKLIGPPLALIAKTYKEKGASIPDFLTEKSGPIVDPKQYSVMKANFTITKALTDDERKALETYILSFGK